MTDEMGVAALPSEDVLAVMSSCQHGHAGGGLAWTGSLYSLVTTTSWQPTAPFSLGPSVRPSVCKMSTKHG